MKLESLLPLIMQSARLAGQTVQRERKDEIALALAQEDASNSAAALFGTAWKAANLEGVPSVLDAPRARDCPFVGWHREQGWLVMASQNADESWLAQDCTGGSARIKDIKQVECISLPVKNERDASVARA